MPNVIDEYLIKLGASIDSAGLQRFQAAIQHTSGIAEASYLDMAKAAVKAQVEVVGAFAAIGGAAIGLVEKVAMADQEYRLFALHMYMSKDAARGLKIAMDALGEPLENLTWDAELRQRTHQLLEDQRAMAPNGDFDAQMRKIRDIRFEFTRLEVELKYFGFHFVQDFMHALGMGPDELLGKFRRFNAWLIYNMPELSKKFVKWFMPVWGDIKDVVGATADVIKNAIVLFTNLVGLLSGDSSMEGATLSIEKLGKALHKVAHGFAEVAQFIAHVESLLVHLVNALTLASTGKFSAAGAELKASVKDISLHGALMAAGGVAGFVGAGPLGAAAAMGAVHEFDRAIQSTHIGDTAGTDVKSVAQLLAGAPALIRAIVAQESGGNPNAVSKAGALGLMQLLPSTAASLGVANPFDPVQNLMGGMKYVAQLMAKYHDVPTMLAAYNAGPGRIDKLLAGKATLPGETRDYVASILHKMGQHGDVHVGAVTINIDQPNATPKQIQHAVAKGLRDAQGRQTQRNISQYTDLGYSY